MSGNLGENLRLVDESEGKQLLKELDYVTFNVKNSDATEADWAAASRRFAEGWTALRAGMTPEESSALLGIQLTPARDSAPDKSVKFQECGREFVFRNRELETWN